MRKRFKRRRKIVISFDFIVDVEEQLTALGMMADELRSSGVIASD